MKKSLPARPATGKKRQHRQKRYGLQALFESMACDLDGKRVRGRCYRRGRRTWGDAGDYQYPVAPAADVAPGKADDALSLKAQFYGRVVEVCKEQPCERERERALDLMCCRFSAGWSQADLAQRWGCHRATVSRCEKKLLRRLRSDGILVALYVELLVQQPAPFMEGA